MTKQLKCYYLLLIRYYKLSLLNQFLEGYSIMAAWGNNFFKKNFFLLFFHFSAPLKCHWPIRASSLKSHSPAGRIYSPLATGRVLMKRLETIQVHQKDFIPYILTLTPRISYRYIRKGVGSQCEIVESELPKIDQSLKLGSGGWGRRGGVIGGSGIWIRIPIKGLKF